MALKTRGRLSSVLTTSIRTERLYPVSRMVSTITGLVVQRNKAIVGRNAFAHEAGIHQDGMLKERSTYEIMRPEDVGVAEDRPRPGQTLRPPRLARPGQRAGLPPADEQFETLFNDFKTLADKKKEVYDEDLVVLIEKHIQDVAGALVAGQPAHDGGDQRAPRRRRFASAAPTARSCKTPRSATAPWTRFSKRSSGSLVFTRTSVNSSSEASPQATTRKARCRWNSKSNRRPLVPRPRGVDRHHRGFGRGLSQRRQRDRRPPRPRPSPRSHRPPRRGGVRRSRIFQ